MADRCPWCGAPAVITQRSTWEQYEPSRYQYDPTSGMRALQLLSGLDSTSFYAIPEARTIIEEAKRELTSLVTHEHR